MCEINRIRFIEQRDGVDEAICFAKRTMKIYRSAVLCSKKRGATHPHHASLPEYRRNFITSYLIFKKYIKGTL